MLATEPLLVLSESAEAMLEAMASSWFCACTRSWSRICRSAAMVPERMARFWIMSIALPEGVVRVIVPTELCDGFAFHCEAAVMVPCALKESTEAW